MKHDKEEEINPSKSNRVTVRIWQARDRHNTETTSKDAAKSGGSVGHASIKTDQFYLSHWPGAGISSIKEIKSPLESQTQRGFTRTVELDEAIEGLPGPPRPADTKETFYSLDKKKIEEEIEVINQEQYVLKQKLRPELQTKDAESCSSAAYRALEKGGINKLSPVCAALRKKGLFAITPSDLERCVRAAKKEEVERYPETINFLEEENLVPSECSLT